MNSTEFHNWCRVELLLDKAAECLRKKFEQCWQDKRKVAWTNSPACGQDFVKNEGQKVYQHVGKIQKGYLNNGDIEEWDLTTLNAVFTMSGLNKNKKFQANLARLIPIRNIMAHRPDKKVTTQEYEKFRDELKDILLYLGATDDELDNILYSQSTGSKMYVLNESVQKSIKLRQEGKKLLQEHKLQMAVAKYTEAITLPGIPDGDLAILYSNRSHCYLKQDKYTKALEDAKMSKRLNPDYLKAYIRLAKAYDALGEYGKVIKHLDKALSLDANNEEIRQMRSEARKAKGLKERDNDERLEELAIKTQRMVESMEGLVEIKKALIDKNPALGHVWAGHKHRDDKKYSEAAECYRRAADMRNAEGMYNLALFMINGTGVRKDYKQAFKLLLEVSKFDAFDKNNLPVVGVKEAEHSIALGYQEGTIVEKDLNQAVLWYEKAISHRNGSSANNLALMYSNGDGVVKDLQKAEQLFLCALNYGDPNAMDNLVDLHMMSGNYNMAEKWNEKSKKLGSKFARDREMPLAQMRQQTNAKMVDIIEWEKEHNLPFENMTIDERLRRRMFHEHPNKSEILESLEELHSVINKSKNPSPTKLTSGNKYDLEVLTKRKDKSVFSNRMYLAVKSFWEAMKIFYTIGQRSTVVLDDDSRLFIRRLAECYKLEHFVGTMPMDLRPIVQNHVLQLLSQSNREVERRGNNDDLAFNQDCRICHYVLNMRPDEIIDFLTECINKYPNNKFFLEARGSMYNFQQKYEHALRDFRRIDQIVTDDVDNLYNKACTMRLMGEKKKAVDAYKKFLDAASVDHRKVPEAYYSMGTCSMSMEIRDIARSTKLMKLYYEKGLSAEGEQIPFFLPYDSTSKELLEKMLQAVGVLSRVKDKPVVKPVDPLRKDLIVNHRRCVSEFSKILNSDGNTHTTSVKPPKTQSAPVSLVGLKPIYLNEIDPTSDRVLDGHVLELTLITDPFDNTMSISFVAEDGHKNVQRVSLYNFDKKHALAIGAKISVINPYLRMAADGKPLIRVDDPNSVMVSPKPIVGMCHYCGKGDSKYSCTKCKQAKYCSQDCQLLDWKEHSHKLVCVPK
ncbi:hypothetical protein BGZ73_008241 [Actinomortierella ambigua]|nr:hypothetical protein BGZ73_008241 [Actinomortierella ambigua]